MLQQTFLSRIRSSPKSSSLLLHHRSCTRPIRAITKYSFTTTHSSTFSTASTKMSAHMQKIATDKACPVAGPYSQAVVIGNTIYVSGQIPADTSGKLVEGSITDKTRACGNNIAAILEAAGSSTSDIVKCNVFLTDMASFAEMNDEYAKIFPHKPARSCVAVKQLPKGVPVEIECIAVKAV